MWPLLTLQQHWSRSTSNSACFVKEINSEDKIFSQWSIFYLCRITEWLRLKGTSGNHVVQPLCSRESQTRALVHNDKSLLQAKQSQVSWPLLVCQLLQSVLAFFYTVHLTPTYQSIWKFSSCRAEKSLFYRHCPCLSYLKWDVYGNRVQGFWQRGPCPHLSVLERVLLLSAGCHIHCFDLRLQFLGAFSRVL